MTSLKSIVTILFAIFVLGQSLSAQSSDEWIKRADYQSDTLSNFDSALVLNHIALDTAESEHGWYHGQIARCLLRIGAMQYFLGNYDSAGHYWNLAVDVKRELDGGDSPDVLTLLGNINQMNILQGRTEEAESLSVYIHRKRKELLGPDHSWTWTSLVGLGVRYRDQGRYAEAEKAMTKAIEELTRILEFKDIENVLANGHTQLSILYQEQERLDEALPHMIKAVRLRKAKYSSEHSFVAEDRRNLAGLYGEMGRYRDALIELDSARMIYAKNNGPESPEVAKTLSQIGEVCLAQERFRETDSAFAASLTIIQDAIGPDYPEAARILLDMAESQFGQAYHDSALVLATHTLDIINTSYGVRTIATAESHELISDILRADGAYDTALTTALTAYQIRQRNFTDNAWALSEKNALIYSRQLHQAIDRVLSCYIDAGEPDGHLERIADVILAGKGQVTDGILSRRRSLASKGDTAVTRLLRTIKAAKYRLSQVYVNTSADESSTLKDRAEALQQEIDSLESVLALRSGEFAQQRASRRVTYQTLAGHLPPGTSLIEYSHFEYLPADPAGESKPRYAALVVEKDKSPELQFLGDAATIEMLVADYRQHFLNLAERNRPPDPSHLDEYHSLAGSLHEHLLAPLSITDDDTELLLIAPDHALNLLSFASLVDDNDQYLLEKYPVHYVSAGRDLLRFGNDTATGTGLLALGNPAYDASVSDRLAGIEAAVPVSEGEPRPFATRSVNIDCESFTEQPAIPLPGTQTEVTQVSSRWRDKSSNDPLLLTGVQATEEAFKHEAPGHRLLHIATHGYFVDPACLRDGRSDNKRSTMTVNPLLLSGLLLSGANLHGAGCDSADVDDGILTAYEVSAVNLRGVERVVLSACESGLGKVTTGEGVHGLRRAFQMAGAQTVISSLWQIPDNAAQMFMDYLYSNTERSLPDALRTASLQLIERLRAKGQPAHPYLWAPFVATGECEQ